MTTRTIGAWLSAAVANPSRPESEVFPYLFNNTLAAGTRAGWQQLVQVVL